MPKRSRSASAHGTAKRRRSTPNLVRLKTARGPQDVTIAHKDLFENFFDFMDARHRAFERRFLGAPAEEAIPLSTVSKVSKSSARKELPNAVQNHAFCNVYRQLDRGTQFLIARVINVGPQDIDETCFRVILYRMFNKPETWELFEEKFKAKDGSEDRLTYAYFKTQDGFEAYEKVVDTARKQGVALYNSAYVLPAPDLGAPKAMDPKEHKMKRQNHLNHMRLLRLMIDTGMPSELAKVKHLRDAYEIIALYPSMGQFLAFQLALDLNLTPHLNWSENEFAPTGPGSKSGLKKIFGPVPAELESYLMLHLASPAVQKEQWKRIKRTPALHPALPPLPASSKGWPKGINGVGKGLTAGVSLVDVEHALCEADKLWRVTHPHIKGKSTGEPKAFTPKTVDGEALPVTRAFPHKFAWLGKAEAKAGEGTGALAQLPTPPESATDASSPAASSDEASSMAITDAAAEHTAAGTDEPVADLMEEGSDAEYDADEEFEVSHIVAEMPFKPRAEKGAKSQGGVQYLVRYVGYGPKDDYWIPEQELDGAPELVQAWKARKERIASKIAEIEKW